MASQRIPEPKSSWSLDRDPSSVEPLPPAAVTDAQAVPPPPYVLPQNLDAAIRRLSDADLDRLARVALEERSRRRGPANPEEGQPRRQGEASPPSLPQGKLNAVRAAFRAGITPN